MGRPGVENDGHQGQPGRDRIEMGWLPRTDPPAEQERGERGGVAGRVLGPAEHAVGEAQSAGEVEIPRGEDEVRAHRSQQSQEQSGGDDGQRPAESGRHPGPAYPRQVPETHRTGTQIFFIISTMIKHTVPSQSS